MPFLETIRYALQQHQLLPSGERVVLGVSGGADSLALMHALHQLSVPLHVATLDHGWRGATSAADAQFVIATAKALQIPVTAQKLSLEPHKRNLEALSRRARYDFFAEVAEAADTRTIATAHHADDQAETVLMRIIRGTGTQGLAGMGWRAPLPYHPEKTLIRPMLGVTRDEVNAYCAAEGLAPRHDPTNQDVSFLRNRLRHKTLPTLRELNPNIAGALVQLGDVASVEADYIALQTNDLLDEYAAQHGESWQLARDAFRQAHPALQRRALAELANRVHAGHALDLRYERILAAQRVGVHGSRGAVSQFGEGVQMRIGYDVLIFEHAAQPNNPALALAADETHALALEQAVVLDRGGAVLLSSAGRAGFQHLADLYVPPDAELVLRARQPGDRLAPPGLDGHTQKLKDWMINRKIPRQHRAAVPLIVTGAEIVAVIHIEQGIVAHPYHLPRQDWLPVQLRVHT